MSGLEDVWFGGCSKRSFTIFRYFIIELRIFKVPCASLNLQRIISLIMAVKPPKRRSERLSRRKSTLINKAHELAEFCDVDVALIIRNRQTGRYFTYNSVDLASWPPSKEQIASHCPLLLKVVRA
jgi:hypothetical protein